jgi:hypothetical protein
MTIPTTRCDVCGRRLIVTAERCAACGHALDGSDADALLERRSWQWQSKTTLLFVVLAIALAVIGLAVLLMIADAYPSD